MSKQRNEVERLSMQLKGYRRMFSRFEKLELMFLGYMNLALAADDRSVC